MLGNINKFKDSKCWLRREFVDKTVSTITSCTLYTISTYCKYWDWICSFTLIRVLPDVCSVARWGHAAKLHLSGREH